jgi:hypothetical protein
MRKIEEQKGRMKNFGFRIAECGGRREEVKRPRR